MSYTVNILLTGYTNSGKTTLLNAILANTYMTSKIKNTTMLPIIYTESSKLLNQKDVDDIRKSNDVINDALYSQLLKDEKAMFECKTISHEIPKLHGLSKQNLHKLEKNVLYAFHDMPSLDSQKTNSMYMKYISDNFINYDIILFLIDPINFEQSIHTIDYLMEQIKLYALKGIKKHLITLVTKIDNMTPSLTGSNIEDQETKEIYQQIKKIIHTSAIQYEIVELCKNVIPISGEEMYYCRVIHHNNAPCLSSKYINKIGTCEYGKKHWYKYKATDPEATLLTNIKTHYDGGTSPYDVRMIHCGFNNLNNAIRDILSSQFQYEIFSSKIHLRVHSSFNPMKLLDLGVGLGENLLSFSNILKEENDLNNTLPRNSIKWHTHDKMLIYLSNLCGQMQIACKNTLEISIIETYFKMLEIIGVIYNTNNIDSSESVIIATIGELDYIIKITELINQTKKLLIAKKQSVVKSIAKPNRLHAVKDGVFDVRDSMKEFFTNPKDKFLNLFRE